MRWRIRHKVTLGLVLIVGIIALLSAGTMEGLRSYRSSMRMIDGKLGELKSIHKLEGALAELALEIQGQAERVFNLKDLEAKCKQALAILNDYREDLAGAVALDGKGQAGGNDTFLTERIEHNLRELSSLARKERSGGPDSEAVLEGQHSGPPLEAGLQLVENDVNCLRDQIHTALNQRISNSEREYRYSRGMIAATAVVGLLFLVGLARMAYRWIVNPIRDLHEKVGRLAEGNFDSRIEVGSNDEIRDLAEAFNHMTERLQSIYRDLARQVNERSRQLVRSEKLAGVGFLAAGVAHEINNPLASIAFCSEALERRLEGFLNEHRRDEDAQTIQRYLKLIQQEAFRCKEITGRLLEFSRVGERQRQWTDVAELVQGVIDMVIHLQSYKDKKIVFNPVQQPQLLINAQEIKSVVLNLVVNALDSMDAGGQVMIDLDTNDGMAVLTIADTGCGMTQEVMENIFEPFFTRSRTGKGTGLGLSISHRIINQHGGEIEGESAGPNQGSTFTVRLPLQPAEEEPRVLKLAA